MSFFRIACKSDWLRGVQYISNCIADIALYKLPKKVEAKQVESIRTKKIFLK